MTNYVDAVYAACYKRLKEKPELLQKPFWEVYDLFHDEDGICYVDKRTAKRAVSHHMSEVVYYFRGMHGELGNTILADILNDNCWVDVDHFTRVGVLPEALLFAWANASGHERWSY